MPDRGIRARIKQAGISHLIQTKARINRISSPKIESKARILETSIYKLTLRGRLMQKDVTKNLTSLGRLENLAVTDNISLKGKIEQVGISHEISSRGRLQKEGSDILTLRGRLKQESLTDTLTSKGKIEQMGIPNKVSLKGRLLKEGITDILTSQGRIKDTDITDNLSSLARMEQSGITDSITSQARLLKNEETLEQLRGRIHTEESKITELKARLQQSDLASVLTSKGRIEQSNLSSVLSSKADIFNTVNKLMSVRAYINIEGTKSLRIKGRIQILSIDKAIRILSRILRLESSITKLQARILKIESGKLQSQARIFATTDHIITSKGRVGQFAEHTLDLKGKLEKSGLTSTETSKGRVFKTQTPRFDKALSFDGTNDYVSIPDAGSGSAIVDDYDESHYAGWYYSVGSMFSNEVGQAFTGNAGTLNSVKFYIKTQYAVSGNVYVKVYSEKHATAFGVDSVPDVLLATSDAVDVTSIGTDLTLFTFIFSGANKISLTNSYYCVSLNYGGDGEVSMGYDNESTSFPGNGFYYNSGWIVKAQDFIFYVYKDGLSVFDHPVFTFESWINLQGNIRNWNRIVSKKINAIDTDGWEITLDYGSGGETSVYVMSSGSPYAEIPIGIDLVGAGWHHLAVIYNNTTASVYLDGAYKGQNSISSVVPNVNPVIIGKLPSETTAWNGFIDEVRIYNRILSATEIAEHYGGLFSNGTDLVGLWHFDEGTGITAFDSSGEGHNGTLYGLPEWTEESAPGFLSPRARMLVGQSDSLQLQAKLLKLEESLLESRGRIKTKEEILTSSQARISIIDNTNTIDSQGRIKQADIEVSLESQARILSENLSTLQAQAYLVYLQSANLQAQARMNKIMSKLESMRANIKTLGTKKYTRTRARIIISGMWSDIWDLTVEIGTERRYLTMKAKIKFIAILVGIQSQARIQLLGNVKETSKARIFQSGVTKKLQSRARVKQVERTVKMTARAKIYYTQTKKLTSQARIFKTTNKGVLIRGQVKGLIFKYVSMMAYIIKRSVLKPIMEVNIAIKPIMRLT